MHGFLQWCRLESAGGGSEGEQGRIFASVSWSRAAASLNSNCADLDAAVSMGWPPRAPRLILIQAQHGQAAGTDTTLIAIRSSAAQA